MFERPVMFNSDIYRFHKLISETTEFDPPRTVVEIRSSMDNTFAISTTHWVTVETGDQSEFVATLEEQVKADEAFAEHEDPISDHLNQALAVLTDEQAETVIDIFPEWRVGVSYAVGERLRYLAVLYKVIQAHTSQADWTPDIATSLFVRISAEDIPEWVQPDSTNPYMAGDKVTHNGQTWESSIDNNVWEPGVYGWEVV